MAVYLHSILTRIQYGTGLREYFLAFGGRIANIQLDIRREHLSLLWIYCWLPKSKYDFRSHMMYIFLGSLWWSTGGQRQTTTKIWLCLSSAKWCCTVSRSLFWKGIGCWITGMCLNVHSIHFLFTLATHTMWNEHNPSTDEGGDAVTEGRDNNTVNKYGVIK